MDKDGDKVEDLLEHWYKKFRDVPEEAHLLCPKVDEDDEEDYDEPNQPGVDITAEQKQQRRRDGEERIRITYWTGLLMAYGKDKAGVWLQSWANRMSTFVHNCDKCVTNWHMNRRKYIQEFAAHWNDSVAEELKRSFDAYDFSRLDKGLNWVADLIEQARREDRPFSKNDLGEHQATVLLAVFEALCYMEYLSCPEKRKSFQIVFDHLSSKKPLKLGNNVLLPAMTYFLFEEDPTRHRFAVKSFERIQPRSVTQEQFDWAIRDNLAAVLRRAAEWPLEPTAFPQIEQFWRSVNYILNTLGGDVMLRGTRSLDVSPGLCDLLFTHIHCRSEAILMFALEALSKILQVAPQVIRDTINDARPFVVVEQLFMTPLLRHVLAQSVAFANQDPNNPDNSICHTVSWIGDWMQSLKLSEKSDACEQLLHLLFNKEIKQDTLGPEGKAACIRAGLDALDNGLQSFFNSDVDNLITSSLSVCVSQLLQVTLRNNDVINAAFNEQQELYYTLGVQAAAMRVMKAALHLDAKVTAAEHRLLRAEEAENKERTGDPSRAPPSKLKLTVPRNSPALWEAFLENVESGNYRLAHYMVSAMGHFISLDVFRPSRKFPDKLEPVAKRVSQDFSKTAEVCGRVMQRLSAFSKEELVTLCFREQLSRVILALTLHSESELRDASKEVIKIVAGTDDQPYLEALNLMLQQRLQVTLVSLNWAVLQISSTQPLAWGFAAPVITNSRNVLNTLCDETSGVLRSRILESGEANALNTWWSAQWKYIERAFDATSYWTTQIEVVRTKDLCRDMIDLADSLMAQSGLIASALHQKQQQQQRQLSDEVTTGNSTNGMHALLTEPKNRLQAVVNMIRLRDVYLVETTVKVVCRLMIKLRDNDHEIPAQPKSFILGVCMKNPDGRYAIPSNVNDQQRAELLKALGEDEDVEVISIRPPVEASRKKQSTIDAWSKSAPSSSSSGTSTPRTNKQDVLELSSAVDKNRSVLEMMAARQSSAAKAKPAPLKPRAEPIQSNRALIESRKQAAAEKKKRDAEAIAKARALRGPEVKGLTGVVGKEHAAPQKNEMLVESDEEDSEDTDDDADVKALISKGQQGQKAVDEATRRRERSLLEKTKGPVKKTRVARSAKDMRARLIPPMDQLHQAILEWDIFYQGNDPPNLQPPQKVANTYPHPEQYKDTFWRLLVSEAWRSFVTSKDETTSKPFGIKIASRMNVDRFLEVTASLPSVQNKERGLSEGDIILLSKSSTPLADPSETHALARIWKTAYKRDLLEVTYRLNTKNNPLQSHLQISSELYAVKITNMTTIEREYAALESLKYYDLMDEVLKAEPSPVLKYSDEATNSVMQNYQLNPGQAKAILGARDNDGFTLIQGPPGTGKTKTIVAMVGALMTGNIPQAGGVALSSGPKKDDQNKKKILVCAPSNAAVDELVLRLKQGIKTMGASETRPGSTHKINVLRLGRSDAINAAVRDVTLDELVKAKMEGDTTRDKMKADRDKMHADAANIRDQLAEIRPQMESARATDRELYLRLQRQFDGLKKDQIRIGAQIDADKESGNTATRELEIKRKRIQQEVLDSAQVLCATLSGSGHEMFKNLQVDFETVIIDEAAQCVELSALIPLKYGATKCILVGDPKQLPPTVLSQSAAKFGYDQSLFVRMQRNHPEYIHMLDRQYRMHPEISHFPSAEFYEGKLVDGDKMGELRRQPWHNSPLLGPYRFFDVEGVQDRGRKGQSLINLEELKVAMQLYARFKADYGRQGDSRGKIGIITPYKAQLYELRSRFAKEYGETITDEIEFNTTDAFQGRECEIIIFSCVRASPTGGIGFMKDIRRMNVGLTRAKSSLWILGDSRALVQGEFWAKLIENAKQRHLYTRGDIMSQLRKSSHAAPPQPSLPATNGGQDVVMRNYEPTADAATSVMSRIGGAAPVIQTSAPPRPGDHKKRPREGDDQGSHGAKRMTSECNRPRPANHDGSKQPPMGPRSMREQQVPRDPRLSQDPSAEQSLGLAPPQRPPAAPTTTYPGTKSGPAQLPTTTGLGRVNEIQQRAQQNRDPGPRHNKKKKQDGGGMFIQRKPNKR